MPPLSRPVVEGNPAVVSHENYRYRFLTLEEARDYVRSAGVAEVPELYAITRERFGGPPVYRWTPRRGEWGELSASTRRGYDNPAARHEAQLHGMSLREWYSVAPDLKTFRRHAPARQHEPDVEVTMGYGVYIGYDGRHSRAEMRRISEPVRVYWESIRRRERGRRP